MTDRQALQSSAGSRLGWLVADPVHGPLPVFLLVLTALTGVVDAVSILGLGRVFVANMTGNIVFIGFALAGAPGFTIGGSLSALIGFVAGAFGAGVAMRRRPMRGTRLLLTGVVAETIVVTVGLATVVIGGSAPGSLPVLVVAALVAIAMGVQNAVVRRLAVPDLTTTVLTLTITGLAADPVGHDRSVPSRRLAAVLTMLAGAIVGAILVLQIGVAAGLVVAAGLLLGLTAAVTWHDRRVERA